MAVHPLHLASESLGSYDCGMRKSGRPITSQSYLAIHKWIARNYPRTGRCEYCGCTDRRTQYASASHARYTRNRADWFEFCSPCHAMFDCKVGKTRPPELVAQIAASLTGRRLSDATREAIGVARRGIPLTEAHKAAISAGMKGKQNRLKKK